MSDERGLHARVVEACLGAWEGATVIRENHEQGVVEQLVYFKRTDHHAEEVIKAGDLIVVGREVLPRSLIIGEISRNDDVLRTMLGAIERLVPLLVAIPATMRVHGREPEEEWLVFGTIGKRLHPPGFETAVVRRLPFLDKVPALGEGRLAGGEVHGHVILADERGVVALLVTD
jgi:hypothetical protein